MNYTNWIQTWPGCAIPAILLCAVGISGTARAQSVEAAPLRSMIQNDATWPDTDGTHINAHGGGVLHFSGRYYWYGENRARPPQGQRWGVSPGVQCYSSADLYNWKNEGVVMKVIEDDPDHDITIGCNIERPKVIHNARTGKFIMWFHLELKGSRYGSARTALATGESPTGPFKFVKSLRPNPGKWPINLPEADQKPLTREQAKEEMAPDFRKALVAGAYARRDFEGGQMARDMTLFVDPDDNKAYLIASAEENFTLNIHELNDDYTDFTGKWMRVGPGGHNEAPALVKHNGTYYILASGCTGWDPNPARVLTARSIWGPWKNVGNPCEGVNPLNNLGPDKTFGGQSTHIFPVAGKPGAYVAMFDVWRPPNLIDSGYIWLPVRFDGDRMVIRWQDQWDLGAFDGSVAGGD